ncbi:MAG: hypothetical protein Q9183_008029, partial [Haloplaca sp. 2 TL-2023]
MVATISTRGSSEGLLGVMVVALLWAVTRRNYTLAGILLGLSAHFKIYPFIYGPSIVWYLEHSYQPQPNDRKPSIASPEKTNKTFFEATLGFFNRDRIVFGLSSSITFAVVNIFMYTIYSRPFLEHTFLYHLSRVDHRHNFSPYNTFLHLSSALPDKVSSLKLESLAFVPQLVISALLMPVVLAKKDLAGTMLAQTFAFVAFNK